MIQAENETSLELSHPQNHYFGTHHDINAAPLRLLGSPNIGAGRGVLELFAWLLFRRRNSRPRPNAAITATPPTVPPAMAPVLMLDLDDDGSIMAGMVGLVEVVLVLVVEVPLVLEELLLVLVLMLVVGSEPRKVRM